MTGTRPRVFGWVLFGIGVFNTGVGLWFAILDNRVVSDYLNPIGFVLAIVALIWLATGAAIVSRKTRNWAGWIFCAIGLSMTTASVAQSLAIYGLRVSPGSVPFVGIAAWINEFGIYPIALLPLLFLLFPDGRAPSPRWRWAAVGVLGGTFISAVGFLVRPGAFNSLRDFEIRYENPLGVHALEPIAGTVIAVGTFIALVSAFSSVIALRRRFKRATGDQRQQMRWLVFVGSLSGVLFVLTVIVGLGVANAAGELLLFPIMGSLLLASLTLGIPAAYGIAIFRYRLYDLDVVMKKTVVIGLLAVFISAVYASVVGGLGALIGSRSSTGLSFVTAAVLAIAFQPVRMRAQRLADRLVYGKRATPYEVLTEFSGKMAETFSSEDVLARMVQILAAGTGAAIARVWLVVDGELRVGAAWPAEAATVEAVPMPVDELPLIGDEHAIEVRHQGELLGAVSVVMPASDPMDPGKDKLVRDLAAQAGLVLRNARLIEDLRASRRRLVAAQDEERRKIERNLHDGAQQQLVALTVQLRLAEQMVGRDDDKQRELLAKLQTSANSALEDLRDLARGIYPPLLADKGLVAALQSQARKAAVPTTVEDDGVGRYDREVESAVYFCALEALNNVAKYADARTAKVRLSAVDGGLTFTVEDDGSGFDAAASAYGTGIRGMADRLDAIGGSLEVTSVPGSGTTIRGRVPASESSN